MPYVRRDPTGRIVALFQSPPEPGAEQIAPDQPEVIAFLTGEDGDGTAAGRFLAADLALIRVVEDLVAVLIEKRVITLTDLPAAAQDKLMQRSSLRAGYVGMAGLDGDDGGKII